MQRRRHILKSAAGALLAGGLAHGRTGAALRAGAAECVATPEKGAFLSGPEKPAEGVHDELFAKILLLDDSETRVAIATLDYLGFDFAYTDLLIGAVAEAAGIGRENVMLNCSHTHNAPLTAPWGPWLKEKNLTFHQFLPERLSRITREATARLRVARPFFHREPTQIGFNRRLPRDGRVTMAVNPEGVVLPWVDVLALRDAMDESLIATLFSHAAHPVTIHATSPLISGDYPGFAVEALRAKRKGAVHLFAQGCSGNVNAFPLKGGLAAAKAAGTELANAVSRSLDAKDQHEAGYLLKSASVDLELPFAPPPPVAELREIVANERNPGKRARREALLAIAERGGTSAMRMRMPLRGFALGRQLCLLGMAHEPFAEYHRYIDRVSPFQQTFAFGYTNGLEAYLGTQADYDLGENGGYETSPFGAALMFESRLPLAREAESIVHDGISKLLDKLHS